jgi:hypothetical protein
VIFQYDPVALAVHRRRTPAPHRLGHMLSSDQMALVNRLPSNPIARRVLANGHYHIVSRAPKLTRLKRVLKGAMTTTDNWQG